MIRIFKHFISRWSLLLIVLETFAFIDAGYLGVALRFWGQNRPDETHSEDLLTKVLFFTLVMLSSMAATGRYQRLMDGGVWGEALRVALSFLIGLLLMTFIFYLFPELFIGRGAFGFTMLFAMLAVVSIRWFFFKFLLDKQVLKRRVLILGTGKMARFLEEAPISPRDDYVLVGYWSLLPTPGEILPDRVVSDPEGILAFVRKNGIQVIVLALEEDPPSAIPVKELLDCKMMGISVLDLPSFFEQEHQIIRIDIMPPQWWLHHAEGVHHTPIREITKKSFDILASLLLIGMMWPIMLLTTLAIWVESGGHGPIIYRQKRVGFGGRIIEVMKFRSMRVDAEVDGVARWSPINDERVTRVGRFIRKTRIDELPQAINVLRGEMSLVGPRPERPEFVQVLERKIPYYVERLRVKPGITGWAQVSFGYGASESDAMEKLMYDLYYVKNHTLFFDLLVLIQSIEVVLFGWGAHAPVGRMKSITTPGDD